MLDTTNAELTLTLEPSGLASTKIRGTVSFHCDTWIEERLTSADQVSQVAKDALKGCIQDVLYGELINIMLALYGSTLRMIEYESPMYRQVKEQFDAGFAQMRLHNVPFTDPPEFEGLERKPLKLISLVSIIKRNQTTADDKRFERLALLECKRQHALCHHSRVIESRFGLQRSLHHVESSAPKFPVFRLRTGYRRAKKIEHQAAKIRGDYAIRVEDR